MLNCRINTYSQTFLIDMIWEGDIPSFFAATAFVNDPVPIEISISTSSPLLSLYLILNLNMSNLTMKVKEELHFAAHGSKYLESKISELQPNYFVSLQMLQRHKKSSTSTLAFVHALSNFHIWDTSCLLP